MLAEEFDEVGFSRGALSGDEVMSLIVQAIKDENIQVLVTAKKYLGDQFASIATKDGRTPAAVAAAEGAETALAALAELRANLRATTKQDDSLMLIAAYHGHVHIMEFLRKRGFDLHHRNKLGQTAAHKAALTGAVPALRWLLGRGADLFALRDNQGKSALHYAESMYLEPVIEFFKEVGLWERRFEPGEDPSEFGPATRRRHGGADDGDSTSRGGGGTVCTRRTEFSYQVLSKDGSLDDW